MALADPSRPLVSIVTPSLNSARYIAETIQSVLTQGYEPFEYVVVDGGSTDGTIATLESSGPRVRFVSGADHGQADAINAGLRMSTGTICAFLNADDTYLPGAISAAVDAFGTHPDAAVVYGEAWYVDEDGQRLAAYPVEGFDRTALTRRCFICQPAAFFRRDAVESVGLLDARLQYALDYDLWIRLAKRYAMVKIDQPLATLRVHGTAKTVSQTGAAMRETAMMLKRHYGYVPFNWVYGYGHYRMTGHSPVRQPPRPSLISALYALILGARYNWRHPLRFSRDVVTTARQGLA